MRQLVPALPLARNLVLGNGNDRRSWPAGGGFLNQECTKNLSSLYFLERDLNEAVRNNFRLVRHPDKVQSISA
jgi:hypothetical protein